MNFLNETTQDIERSGHTPDDIVFIGGPDGHECSWVEFQTLADFEYSEGFGAAYIPTDLIIVFSDGQTMWRGEYDGSEWWEFSTPWARPAERKPIRTLQGGMWPTLASQQATIADAR